MFLDPAVLRRGTTQGVDFFAALVELGHFLLKKAPLLWPK
jgi:hypothetical protein